MMNDVDPSMLKRGPISFDGESVDARLQRRTRQVDSAVTFRNVP